MKKAFLFLALVVLGTLLLAQAPQKMSYQCVVRNSSGTLMSNQPVGLKISILQGSPSGTVVFSESFSPNPLTNANGLLTVEIGTGTPVTGTFEAVDWSNGPLFLKTETDPAGGTSYSVSGTSQLLSVPFSLYSRKSEFVEDNSITSAKIVDGAVTLQDLGDNSVLSPKIADLSVFEEDLGNFAVTTPKIDDLAVTESKLAVNSVTTSKIALGAVTADKLASGSVTSDKIGTGAVTGSKIAQGGATGGQVLKWNGTIWAADDDNVDFPLPYSRTATSNTALFSINNMGTSGAIATLSNGNYGIWGESASSTGIGVYGVNKTSGGASVGVKGEVYSSSGYSGYFSGGRHYIEGNTGIGILNPSAKLEIAGQVKITGGSPGSGKVLTSDGSGLASWQTPESNPWSIYGSSVYYTGGNVGIGSAAPDYKLEIYDYSYSYIKFLNSTSGVGTYDGLVIGTTSSGSPAWIWNYENSNIHFGTNGLNRLIIGGDGVVHTMGVLNINEDGWGAALKVDDAQAIWWDGNYFSWGYGGNYNYFADRVTVGNAADPGGYMFYVAGNAYSTGSWNSSDARFKRNIAEIDDPLEKVMSIRGSSFDFRTEEFKDYQFAKGRQYGFIAQELEGVLPEVVNTDSNGYKSVNYNGILPILLESVKEQQKQIEELKKEIALLKAR